jgi:hypothetical protein
VVAFWLLNNVLERWYKLERLTRRQNDNQVHFNDGGSTRGFIATKEYSLEWKYAPAVRSNNQLFSTRFDMRLSLFAACATGTVAKCLLQQLEMRID